MERRIAKSAPTARYTAAENACLTQKNALLADAARDLQVVV